MIIGAALYFIQIGYQKITQQDEVAIPRYLDAQYAKIVFAGGCFWCTEAEFNHLSGVVEAVSGYTGGTEVNPTYQEVGSGKTKHREAVLVYYNEASTTIDTLLQVYFKHIDPTDSGGQFADREYQYSPAIYYTTEQQKNSSITSIAKIVAAKKFNKPIVTEILPYINFYPAEEYHQDYKDKNPVRYEYYREGSGRNTFIKNNWAHDSTTFTTTIKATTTMNQSAKKWESFTKPNDEQLHTLLTPEQYNVTQKEGTERPFSNAYAENKEAGIYVDIISGEPLFLSIDKYDSGTGWPSFVKPVATSSVTLKEDKKLFGTRTEVRSSIADSHLGHVFPDGPQDRGGMRYCMNSASMKFIPLKDMKQEGYGDYISQLK